MRSWRFLQVLVLASSWLLSGCGDAPKKRTLTDIENDLKDLPAVYITETSHKEILAGISHGDFFLDPSTKEIAWIAYTCQNPNCPGKNRGQGGRPFLFIWRDPTVKIAADGTLPQDREGPPPGENYQHFIERLGGSIEATCPACLEKRNRAKETAKDRTRYSDWCTVYVPAEAAERKQALEAEKQAYLKSLEERRQRKANPDKS